MSSSFLGLLDVLSDGLLMIPGGRAAKKKPIHALEVAFATLAEAHRHVVWH